MNRISIGVQTFDPPVLAKLGRRHRAETAEHAIREAARVIPNVAVDLIYGARCSTVDTARADTERLASLPVTHVSAYALTLDPELMAEEVPLARMLRQGRLPLPSDEEVVEQARVIRSSLRRAGLRRYEISNFARPGFESIHNSLYWESESYLGVGAGAYGCLHQEQPGRPPSALRWGNDRTVESYMTTIEAGRLPTAEEDPLGPHQLAEERVLLALRTRRGLPLSALGSAQRTEAAQLMRARLATLIGDRLVLTSRGMDLHSAIASRLFPPDPASNA